MTIEELTKQYVKAFKNGPDSSETRRAYYELKGYGEALGVDLNKKFFRELLKRYQEKPERLKKQSPEDVNKDILNQIQCYIKQVEDNEEALEEGVQKPHVPEKPERRQMIEII